MDRKTNVLVLKWLHIVLGCIATTAGLILLKHSHIVTGGTAGLSLSLSYLLQAHFYILFALINIPFVIFSFFNLGRPFTLRTIITISLLTLMSPVDILLPNFLMPALLGSIIGGTLVGVGICTLFKNGASLGGSTILALFLHKKYRLNPGKTNFLFDLLVILTSLSAVSPNKAMISLVSISVTSIIMYFYQNRNKAVQPSKLRNLSNKVSIEPYNS
ncbi:YitT family protein [Paenibacillus psychroresistens]|uniref:YitT family protein n=1 Tax=Paenibacillus psychroresistens TaxID=1778678 RepID=A0A6B8RUK5_9BACL|nr:YitT family protein [Paenibacillus psychroresistens]QGQ99295.1 YitT family protein [Paenibacillus psychroresistens]